MPYQATFAAFVTVRVAPGFVLGLRFRTKESSPCVLASDDPDPATTIANVT